MGTCRSTYCAWMDPDIFVHRSEQGAGFVDHAIAAMERKHWAAFTTRPLLQEHRLQQFPCEEQRTSDFSQRYFVVHKEHFFKRLPIEIKTQHNCVQQCDTL